MFLERGPGEGVKRVVDGLGVEDDAIFGYDEFALLGIWGDFGRCKYVGIFLGFYFVHGELSGFENTLGQNRRKKRDF